MSSQGLCYHLSAGNDACHGEDAKDLEVIVMPGPAWISLGILRHWECDAMTVVEGRRCLARAENCAVQRDGRFGDVRQNPIWVQRSARLQGVRLRSVLGIDYFVQACTRSLRSESTRFGMRARLGGVDRVLSAQ